MSPEHSLPPDQPQRDRIAQDLDCTMLVEAAAGTGKTTCLINRMIALLREGKCDIDTLAAITFTRKAASELRVRFHIALERAAREARGRGRQQLATALDQVQRCFIGTIHSFCARLLRERPVEAGVDPGFVELDESLDAQLRQQAWREHVAMLIATHDPVLPELELLGLNVSSATRRDPTSTDELDLLGLEAAELGPAFLQFAEFSDVQQWPAEPVPLPDLQPCTAALQDYVAHMQSLELPDEVGNDKLILKYRQVIRMARRLDLRETAQLMELLEQFETTPKIIHKIWPGKKNQAVAELQRWEQFAVDYARPLLLAWREHRYEPVLRAIRPALDVYERLRRERSALNYQDLLLVAARLLQQHEDVRRYFRHRFTHVLVDEFQDTDPLQAEVMFLLTASDTSETVWRHCRPVPGSLFVVGDPKQSIYRFRRADIQTYNRVRELVVESGGAVVSLSANFRSAATLVTWINGCFSDRFPATADETSPADCPLDPARPAAPACAQPIQRLAPAPSRKYDDIAWHEAEIVARSVRHAIDTHWPVIRSDSELAAGVPPTAQAGDFLIVARNKARLAIYARKLQEYGLPHAVTGGRVLNEVAELELLYICLTAVVRSDDPIALVAALRSELFGVPDTTLYRFVAAGGRWSYYAPLPPDLPTELADPLSDIFQRLRTYAGWLRRMPVLAAVERIAADTGLLARAAADPRGDVHAGSLLKAIELLRGAEDQLTLGDCLDTLGRLVGGEDVHDGIELRPPRQQPVRVMNLHQCKGLEAPFVFLVDPVGDREHEVEVHIDRSGDQPRGFLPIYGRRRGQYQTPPLLAQPRDWQQYRAREQQFLKAETNRLLYVAATRAGDLLAISQLDSSSNGKNPWRDFADALIDVPQLTPGAVAEEAAPSTEPFDQASWLAACQATAQCWERVTKPTYAVQAIKESAIKAGPKPHGAEQGGAEWGTVLHTLLETVMKAPDADVERLALSALQQQELPLDLVNEVVRTVEAVRQSDLWQRARSAEQCLVEVPLVLPAGAGLPGHALPTVLRGVIDLAFRESSGWVIVDYKSERVQRTQLPALVTYYRPQVAAYAQAWQQIVDQPVTEQGLLFTHFGQYVPL